MKIVFINLSLRPGSKRKHLPIGLAYVMTAAKRAGFEFDFTDMDIVDMSFDHLKGILEKESYDVYAFGCIVTGFKYVRKACEIIKSISPNSSGRTMWYHWRNQADTSLPSPSFPPESR